MRGEGLGILKQVAKRKTLDTEITWLGAAFLDLCGSRTSRSIGLHNGYCVLMARNPFSTLTDEYTPLLKVPIPRGGYETRSVDVLKKITRWIKQPAKVF